MQVAFVFPNYWPYVRRGAERLTAEYARHLLGVGHEVDIITSKPGPRRVVHEEGLTVYYESQLSHPVLSAYWSLFRFYSFSLAALRHLARRRYDVVHMWFHPYGMAVRMGRWLRGSPYLYHSMVDPLVLPGAIDRWSFCRSAGSADRVAALTEHAAAKLSGVLDAPVCVLPACVDLDTFAPVMPRDLSTPRVLFTSALEDYRKGATVVLRAWDEIHRGCPEAVLCFAGPFGQGGFRGFNPLSLFNTLVQDPAARARIELVGEGRVADLPRRYAEAAVTVLPAIEEAFGLVLIESLACGTPVVANTVGGAREIVTDPSVGMTVRIEDSSAMSHPQTAHDLAQGTLAAIELARQPGTVTRCRAHAAQWSRDHVGRLLEQTYREMIGVPARDPMDRVVP